MHHWIALYSCITQAAKNCINCRSNRFVNYVWQADMRRRWIFAPKSNIAQRHKMRKCLVGKHETRQINRFWIRPDVRRRTGSTTVEPNVLWQLVLRRARSASSKYFSRYVITCHIAKPFPSLPDGTLADYPTFDFFHGHYWNLCHCTLPICISPSYFYI